MIHYIWFGKQAKPSQVTKQIMGWQKMLPDYQIKEWNETNYDLTRVKSKYVQQAVATKMWAFVSDYVRLDILNKEGGIYLDTDVELIASFDDLLSHKAFIGRESQYAFSTAVIASEAHLPWLKDLLTDYHRRVFRKENGIIDKTPNSKYILYFFEHAYGFQNSKYLRPQTVNDVLLLPSTYFSPINFATHKRTRSSQTIAIHHYAGSWKTPAAKFKDFLLLILNFIFGEKLIEALKRKRL
ncbi:glycosyltransferase family 32 protein [Oenococcus oeni]|uniref:glycosyltransferase family 32 protein n=1 Tax=Oenococcus oeni TaxID=1247 RepID=UPI001F325956|nr:glycosyltransferase [Oenococcus oeni]